MRIIPLVALPLSFLVAPLAAQEEEAQANQGLREVSDSIAESPEMPGAPQVDEEYPHPRRPGRPSYWLAGTIGAAGLTVTMNRAPLGAMPHNTVPTLSIGAGLRPDPHLQLGLELFSWFNFTGDQTVESVVMVMLGGRFHPVPGSGFFVRGSGGFGIYSLEWEDSWLDDCDCAEVIDTDAGLAWSVGAGYQAPVGRHLRLGPVVELLHLQVNGPDGYHQRIVNFGVSITFEGND